MSGIITGFLILSASLPLGAQQLIFKTYTVDDGLVANPVKRIFQDHRGFIWIGTWEGLSKYDGHKFTNYTTTNGLSHNLINDMYQTPDGKLYVAQNNGAVDLLQNDAIVKKGLFSNVLINKFYKTNTNRILAITDTSGVHEMINGRLIKPAQQLPSITYNSFLQLNDSLFIGGGEGSLNILNSQLQVVTQVFFAKKAVLYKIYKDSKKRIWVSIDNDLFLLLQNKSVNQYAHFSLHPIPFKFAAEKTRTYNDILEDDKKNLWIATTHGLIKIDKHNNTKEFLEKDGLPSNDVTCIYQDKEKNIWFGTMLGPCKLVTKNDMQIYTPPNAQSIKSITLLRQIDDTVFLSVTNDGFQSFNSNTHHFTVIAFARNSLYGGIVANSNPVLFFGNNNLFDRYNRVTKNIVPSIAATLPESSVYCSVMDAQGNIFSGTAKGLIIRAGEKIWYENKLPHRITCLSLDIKGYLWAGTWDNGLFRIEYHTSNQNNQPVTGKLPIIVAVKKMSENFPDQMIRSLLQDKKGNIWVGFRHGGLLQLNEKNNGYTVAHSIDAKSGLMSNWVRTIFEDANGNIWSGSALGIDKLIPTDNGYRVFNFSRVNHFFDRINSITQKKDGSLWFGTNKGLLKIMDDEMANSPPLPIFITSVSLGDTNFKYNLHYAANKVKLNHHQNQASFEFSSPGFINEKQILYSFRLFGSTDTVWSKPANLHTVSYASLQPGNYQFEVRTMGWNEKWGVPATFAFSIQLPYWQTGWFYVLISAIFVLIIYLLYRYRIRQITKLQKVRNRIASDLHDDIGATLTNINMLSEISRKNLQQPQEAEKFLNRISEEVTASSQALNDIIWSVKSHNDSVSEIYSRMRRYAAELFDNSNIGCHLNLNEEEVSKKLNMEQRRDIYLIYKEAMNNIYKHAAAKNIWIDAYLQNGKFVLKMKDDGKGFDSTAKTNGNGLKNISARVNRWKGITTVRSSANNGSVLEIIIPLKG